MKNQIVFIFILTLLVTTTACESTQQYYMKNPTTEKMLILRRGQPDEIRTLNDGTKQLIYKVKAADETYHEYYILKDGIVQSTGQTESEYKSIKSRKKR